MYVDAEERKKELMDQNTMTGGMFKMDNDPRLRRLDAYPQDQSGWAATIL